MNFEEFSVPDKAKAALVSVINENFEAHKTEYETLSSLQELRALLQTLGVETGQEYVQKKRELDPATVLGEGKLREIGQEAREQGCSLLVFDFELKPGQVRNIKKLTGLEALDRNSVILEIFAKHARTKEAKIQIEISRLEYLLPRLTAMWSHLGRQRGGIGVRGGEGEQQLELDRRIIRRRIEFFKKQLGDISTARAEQGKKRKNKAITAALVGYTNAGKSSLMNRLCQVNVLEENKLFATLDSTYRMLNPDTHPPMILIDTVGFISNLPAPLINGFKTTLESAMEADLLLLVCDISDPQFEKHLKVTYQVLEDLGLQEKEKLIIFNKKDLLPNAFKRKLIQGRWPNSFVISTQDPEDVTKLRRYLIDYFLSKQEHYDLFVPYEKGEVHSKLRGKTNIVSTGNHEQGIFYRIRVPSPIFQALGVQEYVLAPEDPMMGSWRKTLNKAE